MDLEYIVSGTSFTRLSYKEILNDPTIIHDIKEMFAKFNGKYPKNQLSLLFNAFVEDDFVNLLPKYDVPIYADSGGLQIITLKTKELTEELKTEIYDVQSKIDYAFCFDEIPLYIAESAKGNSARTSMDGKFVVGDEIYAKGCATGKNIQNQINHFKKVGSETKVFVILQGNSKDDWVNFCQGVFEQLDESHYPHIEGLAIADTCIGNGVLEAADMFSVIPLLPCPEPFKKRLHLLGVGSISRLIPIIVMVKSGYLPEDTYVSYDSTSISSAFVFGRFLSEDKTINFDKCDEDEHNAEIEEIVVNMLEHAERFDWTQHIDLDSKADFEKLFRMHSKRSVGDLTEVVSAKDSPDGKKQVDPVMYRKLMLFHATYLLSQLANFTNNLLEVIKDDKSLKAYLRSTSRTKPLLSLMNVKTYEEYEAWRVEALKMNIHSNRINRAQTYEEFLKETTYQPTMMDEHEDERKELSATEIKAKEEALKVLTAKPAPSQIDANIDDDEW